MTDVELRPEQSVRGRPFTHVALYDRDHSVLTSMIEDLRALLARSEVGAVTVVPYKRISWTVHGLQRRVIICDPDELATAGMMHAVGFFGQRRPEMGIEALEAANRAIVREFRRYPSILSYSSWELPGHNWANLVLSSDPGISEQWRDNRLHADAVERLSPTHYLNVRIHQGCLFGGLRGGRPVVIERTRYVDYRARRPWRAVRHLVPVPANWSFARAERPLVPPAAPAHPDR